MIYESTVPHFIRGLQNLTKQLDKAAAYADQKKFETEVLLQSRLAPDQFPLMRQIQIACDTAKLGCARLTGKESPTFEDNEKTLADARARIEKTISWLKTLSASDFNGAETRKITTPRWEGKWLNGTEFTQFHALPNFYFHLTTGYSILRHNGVEVGKKDYLGDIPFKTP